MEKKWREKEGEEEERRREKKRRRRGGESSVGKQIPRETIEAIFYGLLRRIYCSFWDTEYVRRSVSRAG